MDADLSHDPKFLPSLIAGTADADLVIGSRYIPGGGVENWPLRRVMLSGFANTYIRTVTGLRIHDCTGGFRCWRRDALARIPLDRITSDGYSFLVEVAFHAAAASFIRERPIVFVERRLGASKLSSGVLIESLKTPWRLAFRHGRSREYIRADQMDASVADFYRGRPVMITGGLGFIGSNLARRLVDLGADVLLVDSLIPDYGGNLFNIAGIEDRVRVNVADVRQASTMNYLVQDREIIFNLAGQVSHIDSIRDPHTDLEINCTQSADPARSLPASQSARQGDLCQHAADLRKPDFLPVTEQHLVRPTDVNGINKAAGEYFYHLVYNNVFGVGRQGYAHQRLRSAAVAETQPPGIHRLVHPLTLEDKEIRSSATARRSAISFTWTMRSRRFCWRDRATPATAARSTSAAPNISRIATSCEC